ncbi:MAG: glycosyltransferase, partial [Solirubrobacteraceae bacterium]
MIAFASSIVTPHTYNRCAAAGIRRAAEPDSVTLAHAAAGSVARTYNLLLDRAGRLPDLEALVILHEDAEILDPDAAAKLRSVFADPQVAIVGCLGATGVSDLAWWDGDEVVGAMSYHHNEAGGGALRPAFVKELTGTRPVDSLYGVMLALSPWAVANLRFDESVGLIHGYDFDICRQARLAGRTVCVTDVEIAHHHTLDLITEVEVWVAAQMRAAELWDDRPPGADAPDDEWRRRARAAEA